jgi:hypothetical protein
MANVLGQLTIGELQILEIDADPSIGGLAAPLSSVAMLYGSGTGNVWVKTGTSDTAWTSTTSSGTGTVNTENVGISTVIGSPADLANLRDWLDAIWSVGVVGGANITNNGNGTVNISQGTAVLRQMSAISITSSGTTATVTHTAHGLETGDQVYVEGALQTAYNGTFYITVIDANTYTYTMLSAPGISPATGTIYATNDHSLLIPSAVPAITNLALTDHKTNYIYATQDGSPIFTVTTDFVVLGVSNKALVYTVAREGNILYIIDERSTNVDAIRKTKARSLETESFKVVTGGSILGDAGTRHISVTAGAFYHGIQKISHSAMNTATGSTFAYCYRNGSGGWTYTYNNTQIDNAHYDDGTGTLHSLSGTNYSVFWVYMMNNEPSSLLIQYGQSSYSNLANAHAALVPTPPDIVNGVGALLGRITIRNGNSSIDDISLAVVTQFTPTTAANHENLSGLLGGAANDHYHLTAAERTSLLNLNYQVDGGNATSNYNQTSPIDGGGA